MQSLMFLDCFVEKLSKKNLWGVGSTPLGKGRVNYFSSPLSDVEASSSYSNLRLELPEGKKDLISITKS